MFNKFKNFIQKKTTTMKNIIAFACMMVTGVCITPLVFATNGDLTTSGLILKLLGVIFKIAGFIGILLLVWGIIMLALAIRNEDGDSKSKAVLFIVVAIVTTTLGFILAPVMNYIGYDNISQSHENGTCSFVHGRCEVCNGTHSSCSYTQQDTDDYYLAYEASCLSPAEYYYSCSVCGAVDPGRRAFRYGNTQHDTKVQDASISHLKTAGTCTVDAVYYESCAGCGYNFSTTFTVPASGHMTVSYANLTCDTFGVGTGVYVELTIDNLSSSTVTIMCRRNGIEYSNLTRVCSVSGGQVHCTINNAIQTGAYIVYAKCACGEEHILGSFQYNSNGSYS